MILAESNHPCHKFFLYLRSGLVRNLLCYNPEASSLALQGYSEEAVQVMIKYCYGPVEIENSMLGEMLALARYMSMEGLLLLCQNKISKIVTSFNFLSVYQMALQMQAQELLRFMNRYAGVLGFKDTEDHQLSPEVVRELVELRKSGKERKNMLRKPRQSLDVEGESQQERVQRLLSIYPKPTIEDAVPDGLREIDIVDLEIAGLERDLTLANERKVRIIRNVEAMEAMERSSSEDDEPQVSSFNRFKDLDSD